MVIKPASDFSRPASELNANTGTTSGGALPNTNNKPILSVAQAADANASIKNFLQNINFPPVTSADRDKMRAAIQSFKAQIKKTREQGAKKLKGAVAAKPAVQLAAQTLPVSNQVPDIAKYLPAGTDLAKTSFDQAVKSMENTINQMEKLIQNPSSVGIGGGVKGSDAVNVRDK